MTDITITKEEVVAAAGKDPWKLRDEFRAETDPEAIEALATVFREGAAEADEAGGIARYATELESRAGTQNDAAIYTRAGEHLEQTYRQLGAEHLEGVSRVLRRVHAEAEGVLEDHEATLTGRRGCLEWVVQEEETAANTEYAQVLDQLGRIPPGQAVGTTIRVGDRTFPAAAREEIRAHLERVHTQSAGRAAAQAHQSMEESRDSYYGRLGRHQKDLEDFGYDANDSPVNIFQTTGRARHDAEKLHDLLRDGTPDPDRMDDHTAAIDAILKGRTGENAFADLSAQEKEFLRTYFNTLSGDDLAAAGRLRGEQYVPLQQTLANAVQAAWSKDEGRQPAALREFFGDDALRGYPDPDSLRQAIERYNGFGDLMSKSTVTPSDDFTTGLIDSAISRQEWYEAQAAARYSGTPLDGITDILNQAARNDVGAATAFGDQNRVADMLALDWADSQAAGNLLREAALPDNGHSLTPGEEAKLRAGYNVLQHVGSHPDEFLADPAYGPNHNTFGRELDPHLQRAVADIAGNSEYLSKLDNRNPPAESSFGNGTFRLGAEDRHNLFRTVLGGDQEVTAGFREHVMRHIDERMRNVFLADDGRPHRDGVGTIESEIEDMGVLTGALLNAELDTVYRGDEADDKQAKALWDAWTAASTAVGEVPGGWGTAAGLAQAATTWLEPEDTARNRDAIRRYYAGMSGGDVERYLIYDAARGAGHSALAEDPRLAARAEIIPRRGGSWDDLSADDWDGIEQSDGRDAHRAVRTAMPEDWMAMFDRGLNEELSRPPDWFTTSEEERREILGPVTQSGNGSRAN
jgi:hypothetical protein